MTVYYRNSARIEIGNSARMASEVSARAESEKQLRVLRVAHASLTPALRGRERALAARFPNLALEVITTGKWHEAGVEVIAQEDDLFPVSPARTFLTRHPQLFAYDPRPFINALKVFRPHLIDLNHEPYSLPCAELLLLRNIYAPNTPVIMQTAQNIPKRFPPPFSWWEQRAFRQVDAACVCSDTVRETLQAKGFKKPVALIPFGVDLARFKQRAVETNSSQPLTIGFVGRMLPGKGLPLLGQALQLLARENWRALFVGDGPERASVMRQLAKYGLESRVTMTGAVDYEIVPDYLQQIDVLVVPSQTTPKLREQFGRVIVEAMASGVCVVGSDSGAIPEVIGPAGLIFPEGQPEALAECLQKLLKAPQLRQQLAQAGRRRVEKNYTWEKVAEKTYSFYQQVLGLRR